MILSPRALLSSLVVLAALTGCGAFPNPSSPAKLPADAFTSQTSGVVILSSGAPDSCMAAGRYLIVFDSHSGKQVVTVPPIFVDLYTNKSEFADHHGLVSALALRAGDYYLSPVVANPTLIPIKIPAFDFHVGAGETVYIGELYMPVACSQSNVFVINDKFERDVPMAIAANPAVADHPPVKRLMRGRTQ